MNRRIVLVAVIQLSFFSSLAAQTIPQLPLNPFLVYGPKKYERSTGAPQTITNQFTLPPAASSPYTLYVANGWLDGSKRVTSAVIKINGATVVGQNDFKKNLPVIIKTINLNTNNQISITLNGQPGTFITLAITATDKNPPTITITNPKDSLVTRQSSITCTGIVTDETFATLTINGTIVLLGPGGIFSKTVQIAEGTNTITFVARDLWGNTASVTRTVTKDTRPPALTVASPVDGQIISSASVQVSGTVTDASTVIVTANGIPLTVNSNGSFVGEIPVDANVDTIRVTAIDGAQNQTTVTRMVRRASSPPVLTVTNPADSSLTKENTVTVLGTVKDSGTVVLTINSSTIPVLADGSFSSVVALAEGMNQITVIATNTFGQSSTVTRTIRKDSTPPLLTIISPIDGAITRDTVLLVRGTVFDLTNIALTINGDTIAIDAAGAWSKQITLLDGQTTISIVATDAAGNSTTVARHITCDTHPPVLTVISPNENLITRDSVLLVQGTAFDSVRIALTVNGDTAAIDAAGAWSKQITLMEGQTTISIVATDAAGNVTTVTRHITRDTQPPVITIISPIDGAITRDTVLLVQGTAIDSTNVTATIQGNSVPVGSDGSFSTTVSLHEGQTTILIVVTDAAGNSTTITRTVTKSGGEVLPPDPATVAPPLDQTVATTMFAATQFLFTGPNPIQRDVAAGTIDPIKVSVLRGKVLTRENQPLPGVKITILDHPEFGYTLTRSDGIFDLAVNGGGNVTVDYRKSGYLPVQRQLNTNWHDYSTADSVVMIQLDQNVAKIDFSEPVEIAKGSVMTDASGSRQAVLLFTQGTKAQMTLPDGTSKYLDSIHVRVTEYTVGQTGRAAMPAALPPRMRYTYCVEISADEAIAENATSVWFDKPVHFFVDNFLNFPVGGIIPVGWYNRQSRAWMPSQNALVMRVVGKQDSIALVDINDDGFADNTLLSDSLNFSAGDFESIAGMYPNGTSFWWMQTYHFSPCDMNFQLQDLAKKKNPPGDDPTKPKNPCDNKGAGSIIFIQSQTLCETVPLPGTPFYLWYESDRSFEREESVDIKLTGDTLPTGLKRIELYASIAGRTFKQNFAPTPNLTTSFGWDGKDVYGRLISGRQKATFQKAYIYDIKYIVGVLDSISGNYWGAEVIRSWWDDFQIQYIGTDPIVYDSTAVYDDTRSECSFLSPTSETFVGKWTSNRTEIGGWTMNVHHTYEPESRTLRRGDGERMSVEVMCPTISTIAGSLEEVSLGSIKASENRKSIPHPGNRVPSSIKSREKNVANRQSKKNALQTQSIGVPDSIDWIKSVTVDKDGIIYASDGYTAIYKILKDGSQLRVAGTGEYGLNGLSGVATDMLLYGPTSVKVDDDGNVYFADSWNNRICKVTPDGYLTTIAGTGEQGYSGNGGPATAALLNNPCGVALAPDKSIYISDSYNNLIRRLMPDGRICTVAGIDSLIGSDWGNGGYNGDGGPTLETMLNLPMGIQVDENGNAFFADMSNNVVRVIRPAGIIETYAGNPDSTESVGDGRLAQFASLSRPHDVALGKDGALYIADSRNNRIRRVSPGGIITTYAGTGRSGYNGDGMGAFNANIESPVTVAVGPDGAVYTAGSIQARLRKIAPQLPGFSNDILYIPSEDGTQLFMFDLQGRHLNTTNTLTGAAIYTFDYNSVGRLIGITDVDSLQTRIERDEQGNPVQIIAPFGQTTQCSVDSNGYLASVRNEAGEVTSMTYTSGGLLETFRDPKGGLHKFTYTNSGRLILDEDPAGGYKKLERTDYDNDFTMGYLIGVRTSEGRMSTYRSEIILENGSTRQTNIDENRNLTTIYMLPGWRGVIQPDNTQIRTTFKPDPRYGLLAPLLDVEIVTPGGLTSRMEQTRTITEMTGTTVTGYMDSTIVNGKVFKTYYDGHERQFTSISPEGRTSYSWIDQKGRTVKDSIPGIEAVYYTYSSQGFLTQVSQGGRTSTFNYNSQGYLSSVTDPIGRTALLDYDSVGRVLKQFLPGNREIGYTYDANSNLTSLTPPRQTDGGQAGRPAHTFEYSITDLMQKYLPPAIAGDTMATSYVYDSDGMLQSVTRPDDHAVLINYDSTAYFIPGVFGERYLPQSQVASLVYDRGLLSFKYSGDHIGGIISPSNDTIAYSYDGSLPTMVQHIGSVNGTIGVRYDEDFRVVSQSINGIDSIQFTYDNDGLLTQSGSLQINHDSQNGRLISTQLGNTTTEYSYNNLGELTSLNGKFNGESLYSTQYTRDSLGRISTLTGTVEDVTTTNRYTYDIAGRLSEVYHGNSLVAKYYYDSNGNRDSVVTLSGAMRGIYDAQDRMLQYGNASYVYTRNGELNMKIEGADTTRYIYDDLGNLLSATLPNGIKIEYIIDGQNRRIGREVNGVVRNRWIYAGQLYPIAEVDSAGDVIASYYGNYMKKENVTYRIIRDHLGSVRLVVNSQTGEIVQRMDYDEWGNAVYDSNPGFQPFGYACGIYDEQTKLTRFGARDYDASIGRWTCKDPIKFAGGDNNLYSYTINNPIDYFDSRGLIVEVYNEPISSGGSNPGRILATLYGATHAYVHVQYGNIDVMIERIGTGELVCKSFDPNRGGEKTGVSSPNNNDDGSFEKAILDEFSRLMNNPNLLPRYTNEPEVEWLPLSIPGLGPLVLPVLVGGNFNNSNTFAKDLIFNIGGRVNLPPSAIGGH